MTAAIGFPMPKSIIVDDASSTENYAKFIAAPVSARIRSYARKFAAAGSALFSGGSGDLLGAH